MPSLGIVRPIAVAVLAPVAATFKARSLLPSRRLAVTRFARAAVGAGTVFASAGRGRISALYVGFGLNFGVHDALSGPVRRGPPPFRPLPVCAPALGRGTGLRGDFRPVARLESPAGARFGAARMMLPVRPPHLDQIGRRGFGGVTCFNSAGIRGAALVDRRVASACAYGFDAGKKRGNGGVARGCARLNDVGPLGWRRLRRGTMLGRRNGAGRRGRVDRAFDRGSIDFRRSGRGLGQNLRRN